MYMIVHALSPRVLAEVHAHICTHLSDQVTLTDVARIAGLCPTYFCRVFHASTGQTLRAYVRVCRMEEAARLLERTPLPIAQIANLVGCSDQSHLSMCFKQQFGCTPHTYRLESQGVCP